MNKNESASAPLLRITACLLTVAFVVLRLTNVIDWAWYWVLSPLWIYAVIFVLVAFLSAWLIVHLGGKKDK